MTAFRALLAYDTLLREFQAQLMKSPPGIEGTLEVAVGYLMGRLRLQTVGLFWWKPAKQSLVMQYQLHAGALMEGEEDVIVGPASPLLPLVNERRPVVVSARKPWMAYVPLHSGGELLGALRIERKNPLPLGKVLRPLPSFHAGDETARTHPLLEDIAGLFSAKLFQLSAEKEHKKKAQYLQAGSEMARAISETPRLKDMLESVSESIVHHLGFDRIRFFLIDSAHLELHGVSGFQIPGRTLDLEDEVYPLQTGTNSLVEAMLSENNGAQPKTVGGVVAYVPLIAKNQVIGCMAVDNLLSQQYIDRDQLTSLKSLASLIGTAVINARLFEDIEQQAITDGLTKLYVFRYFQQRLKEEIDRADRYSYGVALVMMDVDYFKTLNDKFGHPLGDRVLEFLANTIRGNIRRIDLAARYGGDEFVLVLPEITEQEAWLMAARLLNALKGTSLGSPTGENINVGVTMGIAMYPSDARNGRDLIEAADKALYCSKKTARGDICFFKNVPKGMEKTTS